MVNEEQSKIDTQRDPKDKNSQPEETPESVETSETSDSNDDEEIGFPDFIANLK